MGGGNSKAYASTHVVVVGGNLGGYKMAQTLEKAGFKVTVIEPKDRIYVAFASVRAAVVEDFEERVFVPSDRILKTGTWLRGLATGIDTATRTVSYKTVNEAGVPSEAVSTLSYDYCVVATGSLQGYPMKTLTSAEETRSKLASIRAAIKAANKIVLIGGGPTGLEFGGEIKDVYPGKSVTIAHGGAALVSEPSAKFPGKFQTRMKAEAEGAGLTVELGFRVEDLAGLGSAPGVTTVVPGIYAGEQTVKSVGGKELAADLVIRTTGNTPNSAWLKGSSPGIALDDKGFIKVGLTYQVANQARVFAMGDVAGSIDMKAGWVTGLQAATITANIKALVGAAAKGQEPERANVTLKQTKGIAGIALIPIGKKHGAANTPIGIVKFPLGLKTADLFTGNVAKEAGYKAPEVVAINRAAWKVSPLSQA